MRIGLHDAEQEYMKHKTFPNYALMKISAYHKARGDSVEWWSPMCHYDRVYCGDNQFHNGNDDQEDSEFCKHG